MTDETRESIKLALAILKTQLKADNVIFSFAIDKGDVDNSSLCFIDKAEFLKNGKFDGIQVRLTDLNKGLL
jgi:hypothetical protein